MREIRLFGDIDGFEINAESFIADLESQRGDVTIRVNSGGGSFFDAVSIVSAIKRVPGTTTAIVDGLAASAASFIAISANKTMMTPGSYLMIHEASAGTFGDASDHAKMQATLDSISATIAMMYAAKSGTPAATWRELMKAETWFAADEAVAAGLADGVLREPVNARTFMRITEMAAARSDYEDARQIRQQLPLRVAASLGAFLSRGASPRSTDDGDDDEDYAQLVQDAVAAALRQRGY